MQVSWRIIRISHARTRARTIVANGASLYLSLFFSVRSVHTSTAYIYTCVFGSAGRDGWARRSFGQGVVLGLPRDLRREIDALWEAIAAQPMHRQWRSHLATASPLLDVLFWIPRFLEDILSIYRESIEYWRAMFLFVIVQNIYIPNNNLVFSNTQANTDNLN